MPDNASPIFLARPHIYQFPSTCAVSARLLATHLDALTIDLDHDHGLDIAIVLSSEIHDLILEDRGGGNALGRRNLFYLIWG